MHRVFAFVFMLLLAGCDQCASCDASSDTVSDIAPDETVVFFNTAGWLDQGTGKWHLPVHGWIYEPEDSHARKAAFEEILDEKFDLTVSSEAEANFSRRLNLLLADNERDKRIVVTIAGRNYTLPESAENGHFETVIVMSADEILNHAVDGLIHYSAVTDAGEAREFRGSVRLLDPDGLSFISDIDDTVKISNVTDHRSLLEYTFLLDFVAAPGMAERYRDWSTADTGFHFVSSSPWQLYQPLSEFLDQNGFPRATFSLKAIRFRDETFFDLFRKGTETKPAAIEAILDRYPERKFVLVGDSGEQDPEVYADMLRKHPDQVLQVFVRNVTAETADNARFKTLFAAIDRDRWQLFDDPATLTLNSGP